MTPAAHQIRALAPSFLARFFENEITGGTDDLKASFFRMLSFLAMPAFAFPVLMLAQWDFIAKIRGVDALRIASQYDKTFYLGATMIATGMVTVIVWNSLLVDRRDGLILGVLPVNHRVIVQAKLLAVAGYIALVIVGMNALASLPFGAFLAARNTIWFALRGIVAHFVASALAGVFVFVAVIAVQGAMLAIAGPRVFARVSGWLQLGLVTLVVASVIALPEIAGAVVPTLQHAPARRPWILSTPPVWFLGIYEVVLGTTNPALRALGRTAALALAIGGTIAVIAYPLAYRRIMRDAVEHPGGIGRLGRSSAAARWLTAAIARDGVVLATVQFVLSTIARVERHRFTLALAAGVAVAWALPTAVRWHVLGRAMTLTRPLELLALPLSTMVFLLVGIRIAAALPGDLGAAWIFDAASPALARTRTGLRRVMVTVGVVPIVLLFTPVYWSIWGATVAVEHALLSVAAGLLVTEYLVGTLDTMPGATPWRPERANLRVRWPLYLTAFLLLAGTTSCSLTSWEVGSAGTPGGFVILLAVLIGLAVFLRWRAARRPIVPPDDEMPLGIVRLNLD
jgi:hypothetical protein